MGCPPAPRCLQFVTLGVSVWFFPSLQKPKGSPQPRTALQWFQSLEQHFTATRKSKALVLLRGCQMLTCTTSQNRQSFPFWLSTEQIQSQLQGAQLASPPHKIQILFLPVSQWGLPTSLRNRSCSEGGPWAQAQPSSLEDGQAGWVPAAPLNRYHQCPPLCLTTLTKNWPQINPTPCGIQGLPHAPSRKGEILLSNRS